MKQLIEDYKRKLKNINEMIKGFKSTGSTNDLKKETRLTTKASEYRTFITELERIESNVQPDETPKLVSLIDFTTLRTQKKTLIEIIDDMEKRGVEPERVSDLNGILNLIDSIQDFACDVMGMNPIDIFDFELEEGREDVIKPEDVTKLTYSVITDDVINNIIERKKQGIDCTEKESAEIKGWLRELKLPEEQAIIAEIQLLFPQEYDEYLNEEEDQNGYL